MDVVSIPALQVLLLAIMFLAVLVEIKTGGMGAGVLLGLVAAAVFWGSQYVRGLVDLYQIAMFLAGILCIVFEMLMPTIGLLAGVGVAAMLYSVVLALGGDIQAIYAMLIAFVVSIAGFALIVKRLPSSRLWNKVVLKDQSESVRGYVSTTPKQSLLGKEGEVLSELRPSGAVLLDGVPVDVISEGAFIPKGEKVRVVAVEGVRVVVRKV
ncbi:MAG: serine protease [Selenomonas sp.]|uniref:NfeD family protein n=1 Tax=Selenomonas sp. TaxID=2053611 RepID=UPI0025DE7A9C|nr:NfeD family protein [Selenomonas sp.]MCR5438681.1 serine protease [Selenomonas sp.]